MRVHLVDGTFELYRAHYAKRPAKVAERPDGPMDVKAVAGLLSSMMALLSDPEESVSHLAIAFDHPIRSFRNDLFDGYKTDDGVPGEISAQFDLAEEAMRALGLVVWPMDRYEADDALATAAHRFRAEATQVRILTPDKDLGQCLSGDAVVQVDRIRKKVMTEETVRAVRGVGPASIPDYLALVGDAADGIPGLRGFGAKSVGTLLGRYEHIERIPDDASAWDVRVVSAPRLAKTLAEQRQDALLYRDLATLRVDVPLAEELGDLAYRGAPREALTALCTSLDLENLLPRVPRWQ